MPQIEDVKSFWDSNPLWTGESKFESGSLEFFEEHRKVYIDDCFGGSFDIRFLPPPRSFGQDIQILEPPSSSGIPKVLNDSSFMSIYCAYWLQSHKTMEKEDFLKKIDSFSNKIWYKRFVDLL